MYTVYANDAAAGTPVHPGAVLMGGIEGRGLRQNGLSGQMGISPSMLSDLVHGRRNATAEVALKLEQALGIPVIFWLNL